MAERRSLVEAMKATPLTREQEFVFGGKAVARVEPISPEIVQPSGAHAAPIEQAPVTSTVAPAVKAAPAQTANVGRTPISTRIRTDLSNALKKASLERQLSGTEPNTLTDILEIAVEHWLTTNGHLPKAS